MSSHLCILELQSMVEETDRVRWRGLITAVLGFQAQHDPRMNE